MASGFVEKHPWMTFFLALFAIVGTVSVVEAATGTIQRVAGPPKPGPLPPRQAP